MGRTLLAGISLFVGSTIAVTGQSNSAALAVTANVTKNCTISTTAVNFGAYDPVAANASQPLDGTGTITVVCTKGATAHVSLNEGTNGDGDRRRMRQGTVNYLGYEIYKDAARTDVWGDSIASNLDLGASPNLNPRTFTAYGRVAPAQDVIAGAYSDTLVATVNF